MANENSVKLTRVATIAGVSIGGVQQSIACDLVTGFQKTIPAGSVNAEVDLGSIPVANVKVMALVSSQPATVKTNSSGAPDETLSLVANDELIWVTGDPAGGKFITHDLVKFYISVPGIVDAVVKFGAGVDSTPGLGG